MTYIGVSGKMYAGKTTIADYVAKNKSHIVRASLAMPLKQDIIDMGFPTQAVIDKPPWMRKLLQAYGQAWRAVDLFHWVNRLQKDIPDMWADQVVLLDDVRFRNEADWIRSQGGYVYRIERTNFPRIDPEYDDESETDLDDYMPFKRVCYAESGDMNGLAYAGIRIMEDIDKLRGDLK